MGTTTKKTASKTEKASKNGAVKKNGTTKSNGTITSSYLQEALQEYFGFNGFKGNQEAIIKSLLSGKDTFVIKPTGGGKSLCYQLPAIISEGVAIIVSPLIALMKNQVDLVRSYSSKDDVAHFLNSTLSKKEIREVQDDLTSGRTKMLYVAPETLTKQENLEFLLNSKYPFCS
ncbi:DEAD/DEAH box helicase [Paraflavitalea speifideaquila]|uniref:DEAD/DEAH box helicase n=1 Tax=Paraflavitalea speifideaquila TaxID=3076558 RepID=UPI0028E9D85F|nr:DEAD/DEAH box helicase [Paraflavitalea speifideiaquila]